jgi:hypothetical protein
VSDADELRALRSRLVGSALDERRRIERALHDGVQQDLAGISVGLQLARELVAPEPTRALEVLDELRRETHAALDRARTLAGGIYPSILDARGLADALRALPGPTRVVALGLGRYPRELEAAVYFMCRAAIEGISPGEEVEIGVREAAGELCVEVAGAAESGLLASRDLAESAGGALTQETAPDGRMRVEARFPL